MKIIFAALIAILATGNAYACFQIAANKDSGLTMTPLQNGSTALDFGPISVAGSAVGSFNVTNMCGETVAEVTLSISGNPKVGEFCFTAPDDESGCPTNVIVLNELTNGQSSEAISLLFDPRHTGKKKKVLTIDGIGFSSGEISITTRVIGEAYF